MTGGAEQPCHEPDVATHIQAMLERVRLTIAEASALQADQRVLAVVSLHTGEPFGHEAHVFLIAASLLAIEMVT